MFFVNDFYSVSTATHNISQPGGSSLKKGIYLNLKTIFCFFKAIVLIVIKKELYPISSFKIWPN